MGRCFITDDYSMRETDKKTQLVMFKQQYAYLRVLSFVKNGHSLCDEAQLKLFDLPNTEIILKIYISNYGLCDEAELKLFELPNAEDILKIYISYYGLCNEALLKLLELLNAKDIRIV